MKRVLVCGGREYADRARVFEVLLDLGREFGGKYIIVQGGAGGADHLAKEFALANCLPYMTFLADWKRNGKGAGPIRNSLMLKESAPDLVVAFPGGRGTADMVRKAKAAGVEVRCQ